MLPVLFLFSMVETCVGKRSRACGWEKIENIERDVDVINTYLDISQRIVFGGNLQFVSSGLHAFVLVPRRAALCPRLSVHDLHTNETSCTSTLLWSGLFASYLTALDVPFSRDPHTNRTSCTSALLCPARACLRCLSQCVLVRCSISSRPLHIAYINLNSTQRYNHTISTHVCSGGAAIQIQTQVVAYGINVCWH